MWDWLRNKWSDHAGIILAAVLATTVAIRLLAVGAWSTTTALAILQASGPANVLIGTTVSFVSAAIGIVFFGALASNVYRVRRSGRTLTGDDMRLRVWSVGLTIFLAPLIYILALPAAYFGARLSVRFDKDRSNEEARAGWDKEIIGLVAVLVSTIFVLGPSSWLAQELVTSGGQELTSGYVLRDDGDQVVVLKDRPRQVLYIQAKQINSRQICARPESWMWKRLPEVTSRGLLQNLGSMTPAYPDCPG